MSKKEVLMPKLGESVTEGTINSWLVNVGDYVNKYDPIADVMTDKVNAEVPSSYSGTITELVAEEGEAIEVGSLICYIETNENSVGENDSVQGETEKVSKVVKSEESAEHKVENQDTSMAARYSPAVLKLASENDIDLSLVKGSGMGGRITRKDIRQYIESNRVVDPEKIDELDKNNVKSRNKDSSDKTQLEEQTVKQDYLVSYPTEQAQKDHYVTEIPVTGVRKAIANNMVRSKTEIPHAWMTVEVDVTDLVNYRNNIKQNFKEKNGYNITYFAFFASIVAKALKEFPQLNSTWENDTIIQHHAVNLSIAVAHEDKLFVPVIKNADEKSISGIAKEINMLATKARTNKLSSEDMQGGTFTLNNTGTFGSISSMGIINHPQAAILQVESIVKRPVIINDMFAARDIVNLSLSLDHRILDGLICGRFLQRIRELLENINESSTLI